MGIELDNGRRLGAITLSAKVSAHPRVNAYKLWAFTLSANRKIRQITPFEDGTPFSRGSGATAWRSARAKLLKRPSHTWCVSSP